VEELDQQQIFEGRYTNDSLEQESRLIDRYLYKSGADHQSDLTPGHI